MKQVDSQKERMAFAKASFRRLLVYLIIAGVAMVAVSLVYLRANGSLTTTLVVTVTLGVFVSIVLGGGLMAAGFFSANSGIDETVAGATDQTPETVDD